MKLLEIKVFCPQQINKAQQRLQLYKVVADACNECTQMNSVLSHYLTHFHQSICETKLNMSYATNVNDDWKYKSK